MIDHQTDSHIILSVICYLLMANRTIDVTFKWPHILSCIKIRLRVTHRPMTMKNIRV